MKTGKRGFAAWLLALMLLLSAVQGSAADTYRTVRENAPSVSKTGIRSLTDVQGVQKTVKGHKVTYKIPGLRILGGKLVIGAPAAKASSVKSISMGPMESTMGLNDTYNIYSMVQPVLLTVKPSGASATLSSITTTNDAVLDWVTDSENYLYLKAQGAVGKATITIKTSNGKKASKTFTVKNQVLFSSMAVSEVVSSDPYRQAAVKSKKMYAGDSAWILAQPRPYTATYYDYPYYKYASYCTSAVTFTSSNEKVAMVSPYGDLYAKSPGKAIITAAARDGSKKKYSFPLTVKAVNPTGFTIASADKALVPGMTYQMEWAITPYAYYDQKILWSSSDPSVASVDANGLVTAVSPYSTKTSGSHSAVITGKTNTGKLTDACTVTVTYDNTSFGTKYRFYGIGNNSYGEYNGADLSLRFCINDMNLVSDAVTDASYAEVHRYSDQTGGKIREILQSMVNNSSITENDVTVFFYSGHGTTADDSYYRGALCGIDVSTSESGYVPVDEIQSYLDQVPGTVVVILDSCLSGQFITSKSLSPAKRQAAVRAFNGAWISALSDSKATNFTAKALTSSAVKSKYKILTAAEALEDSWDSPNANVPFGWFTYWVGHGLGRIPGSTGSSVSDSLRADANSDKVVTLDELYDYVSAKLLTDGWDAVMQQHTQVWPANDNFPVVNKFGS